MSSSQTDTVYIILGPTGSGKSEYVSALAKRRDISLISADSVQVYRGLDIGSAKPSVSERSLYPHYLIDIKDPDETFTVADFLSYTQSAISQSIQQGRLPVISGGTAFYLKNFIYGLSQAPPSSPQVRQAIKRETQERGLEYMYSELCRIDPVSASRIDPHDSYRIQRAIEVYRISSSPLSSFTIPAQIRTDYDLHIIGIWRERDELRLRIRKRLDTMLRLGLEDEVHSLISQGLSADNQSMKAIGYREFFLPLSRDEIIEKIYLDTVHYAKRQMTFFRSLPSVKWIKPE